MTFSHLIVIASVFIIVHCIQLIHAIISDIRDGIV
jgi:hypothetical protein